MWLRPHLHHTFYRTIPLGLYFNNINANSIIKANLCAFLYFVGIQVEYINLEQCSMWIRLLFLYCPHTIWCNKIRNRTYKLRPWSKKDIRRVHVTSSFSCFIMSLFTIGLHERLIAKTAMVLKKILLRTGFLVATHMVHNAKLQRHWATSKYCPILLKFCLNLFNIYWNKMRGSDNYILKLHK